MSSLGEIKRAHSYDPELTANVNKTLLAVETVCERSNSKRDIEGRYQDCHEWFDADLSSN